MSSKNKFWAGVIALALATVFLASMILTQPIAAAPGSAAPTLSLIHIYFAEKTQ